MSLNNEFGGIRQYEDTLLKTPIGYMELVMSASINGENILYAKELTTGKARFFRVQELSANGVARSPAFITGAVMVIAGAAILTAGFFSSFHKHEIVEAVKVFTGVFGMFQIIIGLGLGVFLGNFARAFPLAMGGVLMLSFRSAAELFGLFDAGSTTQTVKKMFYKFSPGAVGSSLMMVGLGMGGFFGYSLYRVYRKFMMLRGVSIPSCETTFDLFTMAEIPQAELNQIHADLPMKFRIFVGTRAAESATVEEVDQPSSGGLVVSPQPLVRIKR